MCRFLGFPVKISAEEQLVPFGTLQPEHLLTHQWDDLESNSQRLVTMDQSTASQDNSPGKGGCKITLLNLLLVQYRRFI